MKQNTKIKIFTESGAGLVYSSNNLQNSVNKWLEYELTINHRLINIICTDTCYAQGGLIMTITYSSKEYYIKELMLEKIKIIKKIEDFIYERRIHNRRIIQGLQGLEGQQNQHAFRENNEIHQYIDINDVNF